VKSSSVKPNFGVGKRSTRKNINGDEFTFVVEDAVGFEVGSVNQKYICLQKIQHLAPKKRVEYRFAYYMIGVKEGAKGRWVFGQYALMIAPSQLKKLLQLAVKKWPEFTELMPKLPAEV
jgi:hypothetical protein